LILISLIHENYEAFGNNGFMMRFHPVVGSEYIERYCAIN
jgi:hypothetical protein